MNGLPTKPRILVVAGVVTDGFMRDDLEYLADFADVQTLEIARAPHRRAPARIAWAFLRCLHFLARWRAHVVIFWFASGTYTPGMSLLAKLFGAKVVLITGGIDAVYIPGIDWGALKSRRSRLAFGLSLRLADVVLPFSSAAARALRQYGHPRRMRVLYPAVDLSRFARQMPPRVPRVVTCCYAYDANNVVQKGLDVFLAAAGRMPDVSFVLVGNPADDWARELVSKAPPNVELRARIPDRDEYAAMLASSAVYAQLSAHEGFGVSVAEAMASGAIPVVSDRFSLPEVVADTGHVVPYGQVDDVARAIRVALTADDRDRARARARASDFVPARRVAGLREELGRLLPPSSALNSITE
ncbi:MAG TPA: glycosyltransferase family 4 protein [Gemmatimonadaceae bacterium]|nr:glycosyltransferase family 4 protein [Gemmatimonadaceae bacterium]